MGKYRIDDECYQCDDHIEPYGCINHNCSIYRDYQEGRAEMAADDEYDRRKDALMEEEWDNESDHQEELF